MIDYHNHIGDKVRIVAKDGEVLEGEIISYEVGLEEDLAYDSIGIRPTNTEGYYVGIHIPDIVKFEVLRD